ncbi:thioredoxin [Latimeria chalumnae]|uniref:Thioredoxin n=1 Tax=Latimeria chalumnae TaxID=7897 RepID=H2ZY23_LATCH|nr:PREDICTED: thioredoxin-like [Latimeria chalumnae]|eukprot:XP_005996498.1 PREDICTED: thioredoxin-like [Latimeria chalumnae]
MVRRIDNMEQFDAALKEAGSKLVVVDFFAEWCGPCKMIAPKIEALSKTYTNVVFLKVDVDEAEDVAQHYEITAMPTFIFFKDGKKLEVFCGANADKLVQKIEELK